jgi:transposase
VQLRFTPTYSSWFNHAEQWFAKIARDVIARGIFTSIKQSVAALVKQMEDAEHAVSLLHEEHGF